MLFPLKSYAKKSFTVCQNYFSIKSYSTFSAKMFKVKDLYIRFYHSEVYTIWWYTVYLIMIKLSESETAKKWLNEVDMDTKK